MKTAFRRMIGLTTLLAAHALLFVNWAPAHSALPPEGDAAQLIAQVHSMDGMDMPMPMDGQMPMDAAEHARMMQADREGSEFNHHLAGFFVVFAGVFFL